MYQIRFGLAQRRSEFRAVKILLQSHPVDYKMSNRPLQIFTLTQPFILSSVTLEPNNFLFNRKKPPVVFIPVTTTQSSHLVLLGYIPRYSGYMLVSNLVPIGYVLGIYQDQAVWLVTLYLWCVPSTYPGNTRSSLGTDTYTVHIGYVPIGYMLYQLGTDQVPRENTRYLLGT